MKKLLLAALLVLFCSSAFGQNKDAIIRDFLRSVGETDTTTGAVTGAICRTWMNEFFREASYYGVYMRETLYVGAAGRDTFVLPTNFLFANRVKKSIPGRGHDFALSDSANGSFVRTDTLVLSASTPVNLLAQDVGEILSAFRKEANTGKLKAVVRVTPDSLQKISVNPQDYYYFIGQPFPRFVAGQKAGFADTVFLEVAAILPQYGVFAWDSVNTATGTRKKFMTLFPPAARADTFWVNFAAILDTAATLVDSVNPIPVFEPSVRPAIGHYLKEQYYRKKGFFTEADYWLSRWRFLLMNHAFSRGIRIAVPAGK